jgi:hypothetical protein
MISHNDTHYNTRFKNFLVDSVVINGMCELPSVGPAFAGMYANEIASQYTNEIIEDEINKPLETKFACEIRFRGGPGSKSGSNSTSTPPLFNGVGLFKEHLPVSKRTNPLIGPTLPARIDRTIWSRKFFNRGGAQSIIIERPTENLSMVNVIQNYSIFPPHQKIPHFKTKISFQAIYPPYSSYKKA